MKDHITGNIHPDEPDENIGLPDSYQEEPPPQGPQEDYEEDDDA